MFEPLLFATVVLWEHVRSPFVAHTHTHARVHTRSYTCRASSRIEKKNREDRTRGRGFRTIWTFNISIFAALPCVVWLRVHPRASVLSIQVSTVPGEATKQNASSHAFSHQSETKGTGWKSVLHRPRIEKENLTGNKKKEKEKKYRVHWD